MISSVAFILSVAILLMVFALYPCLLWILSFRNRTARRVPKHHEPSVSILVAVRNAEQYIGDKIENFLQLDYPPELLELVLYSDGSTDKTAEIIRSFNHERIKFYSAPVHNGKADALNKGLEHCTGDVVVFSDGDAILDADAVKVMVRHYEDPVVGGVCGQRIIAKDKAALKEAQSSYIRFDSVIKMLESQLGRITSNDGKLYSIRREHFRPIPEGVTDDLYVCLSVIGQGHRFVFDPEAKARVRVPSRSVEHEVERRRRIVCRSLRGIYMNRSLLNPLRYGTYSVGLFVNKILRRFIPLSLLALLASTCLLIFVHPAFAILAALQGAFYATVLLYPLLSRLHLGKLFRKAVSLPFYFFIGNYGTLLGVVDFVAGRKVVKWEPRKSA